MVRRADRDHLRRVRGSEGALDEAPEKVLPPRKKDSLGNTVANSAAGALC
jgi:hypothetical protein